MKCSFEIAAGTVPGRRHVGTGNLLVGKNNQDGYGITYGQDCMAVVVCDGCSSGALSECGAQLAAEFVPDILCGMAEAELSGRSRFDWDEVKDEITYRISSIVEQLCGTQQRKDFDKTIRKYFLFTMVGAVITDETTRLFAVGDGVFGINGQLHTIGPFEENAPPYIAYGLLPGFDKRFSDIVLLDETDTQLVDSLVIGTDGVTELVQKRDAHLPGKIQSVGPISKLWTDDCFFDNRADGNSSLTRWLRQVNSEVVALAQDEGVPCVSREYGLLPDDTTVVVLRRKVG